MSIKESSARLSYLLWICVDFNVQYRYIIANYSDSSTNIDFVTPFINIFYDFRVKTLVGEDHPTKWKLIDKLR